MMNGGDDNLKIQYKKNDFDQEQLNNTSYEKLQETLINLQQNLVKNLIIFKKVRAGCPNQISGPFNWKGSSLYVCEIGDYTSLYSYGGYSLSGACTISGCGSILKISSTNAIVYSPILSSACTFTMTCSFAKNSDGTLCNNVVSNSISLSFSSPNLANCIVPQTVSSLTFYLNEGSTNVYQINTNAFAFSTTYFTIGSTCSTNAGSLTTFTTTPLLQTLNIDTSYAYSLAFQIQCSFTDVRVSSGLTYSAQTASFKINVCQYTAKSLSAISLQKGQTSSTTLYSFTDLFTVSDTTNCPPKSITTTPTVTSSPSTSSNIAISIQTNQLKIQVTTSTLLSITQTYTFTLSFSDSKTQIFTTGSQSIQVTANCALLSGYTLGSPINRYYYTSGQMITFNSDISTYMMIASPNDNACTYSSCYISPNVGKNYMTVDNTIAACQNPSPTSNPACQTKISTIPTVSVQQNYSYSCISATTPSSVKAQSNSFLFTYYMCENTSNTTLYSIQTPSSSLTFSYNPYATVLYATNYVFIQSIVPGCVGTCQALDWSVTPNTLVSTKLTINSVNTTSLFKYTLQSVDVKTIAAYNVIASCSGVDSSYVLSTSNFQIVVQVNCSDNSTYQVVTPISLSAALSFTYNQNSGSVTQTLSFSNFFQYPDASCQTLLQSCSIVKSGTSSVFVQSLTLQTALNTFSFQVQTNFIGGCAINDFYQLNCSLQLSGTYILSNQFNMQLNRVCNDPNSFTILSSISDIPYQQFYGTNSSGTYSTQQQINFSQFFIALCPLIGGCTFYDCQIYLNASGQLSTFVTYIAIDNMTKFKMNISTTIPQFIAGLQLKCNLASGNPSTQILSSLFNVNISCSAVNSSVSSFYPVLPAFYNVSVAIPIKVTLNNIITLSLYSNVSNSSYCVNFYYKYTVISGDASQNAILIFNQVNGQLQIYNSQQFIYQIRFAIVVSNVTYNFPLVWLNQTCQMNSTVVSKPQTFSQLQLFVVNPSSTPTFSFDNFLTSNPCCLIQKYSISGINVYNLILLNNSKVMLNNPALNMKYASYSFQITATAQGGASLTLTANLTVVPDCTLEKIYLNPQMPDFSYDPNYKLYRLFNGLPLLSVNQSSKEVLQSDFKKRFYSLNDYYCKFINFKIKQVLGKNDKGVYAPLSSQNYSTYFSINNQGIFKIRTPLETNFTHYLVYVIAQNIGKIWGGDTQQYLIDSTVYPYINPLLVDNKAYFLWDPKGIVINLLTVQNRTVQQILPPISKATNNIIFNNKNYHFVSYQLDKFLGLLLMIDLSDKTFYSENFSLQITLQNSNNGNYKGYKIPLELMGNQTLNIEGKTKIYNCSASISSISTSGIMTILFNETMQNQFDISYVNISNTIITLIPALSRDLDTDFDPSSISFDWQTVSLIDTKLIIYLNFSNPQALSPLNVKDRINVLLNGSEIFFFGAQTKLQVGKSFWELNHQVPRQINSVNSMQGQIYAGKTIMMIVLALGLFLKMLGQKSDEYLLLMMRPLQLIMHLPIYQVIFPQNVIMFIQIVIKVSQFDILDNFWHWDDQNSIKFDPNVGQQRFDQLASIGYEKNNSLIALSTVGFLVLIYWIRLIVFSLFKLFYVLTQGYFGGKKLLKTIQGELFFNMILEVTLEAYLEFGIDGYINIRAMKLNYIGEIIGFALSCFCIFLDIIFLPAVLLWINLFKDKYDLRSKAFKEKWGVVYNGYKYHTKYVRLYALFFVCRRMCYLILGFAITDYKKTGVQLIFNMIMNLLALIFVGLIQAQVTRLKNRIEMINELYVVLAGVFLPSFSEMTRTLDLQSQYGQIFIYVVASFLAINLYFVMKIFYSSLKLIATKINNYFKIKYKINFNFFLNQKKQVRNEYQTESKQSMNNKQIEIFEKVLQKKELNLNQNNLIELKQIKPRIIGLYSKQKQVNEKIIKKSKIVNMTVIDESKNESMHSLSQSIKEEDNREQDDKEEKYIEDIQAYEFIQVYKKFSYMFDVPGQEQLARDHKYKDLNEQVGPFVFNQSDTQQETLFKFKKLISIAKNNISFSKNIKVKLEFKELQSQLKKLADQYIISNTRQRI